jgi:hypothetical protein
LTRKEKIMRQIYFNLVALKKMLQFTNNFVGTVLNLKIESFWRSFLFPVKDVFLRLLEVLVCHFHSAFPEIKLKFS